MTFDELLRDRAIERVEVEPAELADLLRVARRDIRTAQALMHTDLDWAFAIAYNAILQSSIAYMGAQGFRPRGQGKHFNTFRFMAESLPEESETMDRLQRLRKKRNSTVYEHVGLVGEADAKDIIAFAERFCDQIGARMPAIVTALIEEGE